MTELTREDIERLAGKAAKYPSKHEYNKQMISVLSEDLSSLCDLALEALDQREQGGWRPIETAPEDVEILVIKLGIHIKTNKPFMPVVCSYDSEENHWDVGQQCDECNEEIWIPDYQWQPTHWRPLPTPPQEQEG